MSANLILLAFLLGCMVGIIFMLLVDTLTDFAANAVGRWVRRKCLPSRHKSDEDK